MHCCFFSIRAIAPLSLCFFLLLGFSTQAFSLETYAMQWSGSSDLNNRYEEALVRLALESSKAEYGPYTLEAAMPPHKNERGEREFSSGLKFQITCAPYNKLIENRGDQYHLVKQPIAFGLWGYRNVIVHRDNLAKFEAIKNTRDLSAYKVGQVSAWADVDIYRQNGVRVGEVPIEERLLPMLERKRFDFVAVGIAEIDELRAMNKERGSKLVIAEDVVLFYPLSLFIVVNSDYPVLIRRLEKGMLNIRQDGSLKRLFLGHYGEMLSGLELENPLLLPLVNRELSALGAVHKPVLLQGNL